MNLTVDIRLLENSGIGRYIKSIVPQLTALPDLNLSLIKNENPVPDDLIKYNQQGSNIKSRYYSFFEQIELPYVLRNFKGLLWVPHYNFPVLYGGDLLVTVHDLAHLALPDLFKGFHKQLYARSLFSALKYRAEKVICVSKHTKRELIRFTGIDAKKIRVIYNGIGQHWHEVKKNKNPEDRPYILYVGNVKPHKNLHTLVSAFLKIKDKIPHNLVLVGQKKGFITGEGNIDGMIAKAPARITFTGFIPDHLLKQYYAHADLFVFPSLYEGFGYPPLEAMACGAPVIASNAASIPEVCGTAAEYFSPSDTEELVEKMERVLSDNALRGELTRKGKKRAKRFTVEKTAEQTIETIKYLLT